MPWDRSLDRLRQSRGDESDSVEGIAKIPV